MLMTPTSTQLLSNQHNEQIDSTFPIVTSESRSSPTTIQTDANIPNAPEYLAQLLKDRRQLAAFPNMFYHVERLLDQEINNVRVNLFNLITRPKLELPNPKGEKKVFQEKVYIPVQQYPEYNFVGRILGPRGLSAKQFEAETGCKIIVRGRGSFRDKQKEEEYRGKPNYEHLDDELHVILQCEDYENRAKVRLEQAKEELNKLLKPPAEGEDLLKKKQLTELAILKGTYRDPNTTYAKNFNQISIGAPLILTPQIPSELLTTSPTTQSILTTIPQTSILPDNQSNFLQIFTPFQSIDQMGGFLTNETPFFEYQNQTVIPILPTTTTSAGLPSRSTTDNNSNHLSSVRYQPYAIPTSRHNRP